MLSLCLAMFISCSLSAQESGDHDAGADDGRKWTGSGALGYTQNGGNTNSSSVSSDLEIMREGILTDALFKAGLNYGYTRYTDKDIVTVNNNFAQFKVERFFKEERRTYAFGQVGYESDKFQGYWAKYMADTGLGYNWISEDDHQLKTEVGYSYIGWSYVEPNDDGETWDPTHNALFRVGYRKVVNERLKLSEDAAYYLNCEDTESFQAESRTALTVNLTSRLGYKTSLSLKYNNRPLMVAEKDRYGDTVYDEDDEPVLTEAERIDYTWSNMLVISMF